MLGVVVLAVVIRAVVVQKVLAIRVVVRKVLASCCYVYQNQQSVISVLVQIFRKTMSGVGLSRVTLDELLEEEGVFSTQLDKTCTREHLRGIAMFLESWRTVASHLGLSNAEVEEVQRDGTEEKERKRKILEVWKARFGFKATYKVLIEALLEIGRADQAQEVCHLLVQQHKEGIPFTWGEYYFAVSNQCIVSRACTLDCVYPCWVTETVRRRSVILSNEYLH